MSMTDNITLCLTIGKRPQELTQSLTSLLNFVAFEHIIAINDFGDRATNDALMACCPNAMLIDLGNNLGHHKAVDYMYSKVKTDYIFHSEDDWLFTAMPDLRGAMALLETKAVSCVGFRRIDDFIYDEAARRQLITLPAPFGDYVRADHLHDQWHGYTFNPHLAKKTLWQRYAPFAQFKKERHISRRLRKEGRYVAYQKHGVCHHIGHDSVSRAPTLWQKIRHLMSL